MSAGIRGSLRGAKAGRSWEKAVGFSLQQLMRHIERQFLPGMSWDNIGDWHIDHIVPKASFSYVTVDDPEFRACWSLTNLRPLWRAENISKHAKRLFLL